MCYNNGIMSLDPYRQEKVDKYMARARQTLATGKLVMAHEDYITAVNRAYYAIFYAANALLATKGLERSKHSGVIAAFRQHFVKTGIIEVEMSDVYGEAMDDRHDADYELEYLSYETAGQNLNHAERFIKRVEEVLTNQGWLK
jgi:uncharacterized protein (UPF0332 family)